MKKHLLTAIALPLVFLVSCSNEFGLPGKEISKEEAQKIAESYSQANVDAKYEPTGTGIIEMVITKVEGEAADAAFDVGDKLLDEKATDVTATVVQLDFTDVTDDVHFYADGNALSFGAKLTAEDLEQGQTGGMELPTTGAAINEMTMTVQINADGLLTNMNAEIDMDIDDSNSIGAELSIVYTYTLK